MPAFAVPAPIGGWNARDPLDAMEPSDAIDLVNWFPQAGAVYGRGGSVTKLTIAGGNPVDTLAAYTSATASKLLAGCGGKLYDITNLSSATQLATGFASNVWQTAHFNNKLIFVNGVDLPQAYDGTAVAAMTLTTVAVPVVSSTNTSTTGGTLAAATYYYRVSAINSGGETLACTEVSQITTGTTSTVTINWTSVPGATGYKVYGRATGAELLIATVGLVSTYTDTGSVTPSGALPASNTTPKVLIGALNMKGRAVYWEKTAAGFWYATAGAYQGSLSYFPLDTVFNRGGHVGQIITWSRGGGDGFDDVVAIISSNGEALVWKGDDPGDATAWSLVGRYLIGTPLSVRAHCKIASAEVLLTTDGFVSLDEAMVNQRTQESASFGGKIIRACNSAAQQYRANFGWECTYYPRGQMFLANIPIATGQFEQYVRNMSTGSWCRFTGWNARTFCVFNDRLYFGTADGGIVLADTNSQDGGSYPYADDAAAVTYNATQAYVRLTQPGMKSQLTGVQIISNIRFQKRLSVNVFSDYRPRALPDLLEPPEQVQGQWDVSDWDTDYWAYPENDPTNLDARPWLYSVIDYGFALATSVRYMVRIQQIVWYSTNYLFRPAGV